MSGQHAIDRAFERYGIVLDVIGLRQVEARLGAGEGMLLRRNRDGAEVKVIRVAEQLVTAVFSPRTGRIITFKPAGRW